MHDKGTLSDTIEPVRLWCGEFPRHITGCCGLKRQREKHGAQAEYGVSESSDLGLANFLPELTLCTSRLTPVTYTTGATASALEQDSGRTPL